MGKNIMEKKEKSLQQRYLFLAIGLAVILLFRIMPVPASLQDAAASIKGGSAEGAFTLLGIMVGVVFLWITEPIPIAVSALLIPIFVALFQIDKFNGVFAATFGSNVFAFFMGILTLSVACRKSVLSKRLASYFGLVSSKRPGVVLFGIMLISFFISMWITDMAAVGILIPVAIGILTGIGVVPQQSNFGKSMMLGISWGSIFGGVTTPAGVGSNIIAMNFLSEAGAEVTFTQWLSICLPIGIIGLVVGFAVLMFLFRPEIKEVPFDKETLRKELKEEKWTVSQVWLLIVFAAVIVAFLTSDLTGLNINLIAFLCIPLLLLPEVSPFKGFKEYQSSLNWGAIILAVAGVSLGNYAQTTGLSTWIANFMFAPVEAMPKYLQIGSVALLTDVCGLFLSSMTITATILVPIVIAFAQQSGAGVLAMTIAATCASSTVIVLVTQTPTLTLTYAEGYYSIKDCAKAGIIMTVLSTIVVSLVLTFMGAVGMV